MQPLAIQIAVVCVDCSLFMFVFAAVSGCHAVCVC